MYNHFQFKVIFTLSLLFLPPLSAYYIVLAQDVEKSPHKTNEPLFIEVTETHLPVAELKGFSNDGDLDLLVGNENADRLRINNGSGQ